MPQNKKTWVPGLSVYLGDAEESKRRLANLDAIARTMNMKRSEMIRKIADGELVVVSRPPDIIPRSSQPPREGE